MNTFNKRQQEAQASFTKAKSAKYLLMINNLISPATYGKWVVEHSKELENALMMLASKPKAQLDVWGE